MWHSKRKLSNRDNKKERFSYTVASKTAIRLH